MTEDLEAIIKRKLQARRRQAIGKRAEQLVERRLQHMGLELIEKVEVGVKVIRGRRIFTKPVSGDFRAVVPVSGKSVLVEVKCRDADRLVHSDIEQHQFSFLGVHEDIGGCSLLAWVHLGELALIEWSRIRAQLLPLRTSLTWTDAISFAIPSDHTIPLDSP
jgi:hypothetical protein